MSKIVRYNKTTNVNISTKAINCLRVTFNSEIVYSIFTIHIKNVKKKSKIIYEPFLWMF